MPSTSSHGKLHYYYTTGPFFPLPPSPFYFTIPSPNHVLGMDSR